VAVDATGSTVGFGSCGARRAAASNYAGEVFTLYVEADAQGRGVGRRLLLHLFGRLMRRGLPSALVWVLRDNPSRFFYERLGGKAVATRPIGVGGIDVDAVAYGWRDLAAILQSQSKAGY
jgi:ribosomal protein S18 acetylase RimI-like enzyme